MRLQAVLLRPLRLAAGTGVEMAFFGADDAAVAGRQLLEAGITVTLIETLAGLAPAVHAGDLTEIIQRDAAAEQLIEGDRGCADRQRVTNGFIELRMQFAQRAGCVGHAPISRSAVVARARAPHRGWRRLHLLPCCRDLCSPRVRSPAIGGFRRRGVPPCTVRVVGRWY